MECRNFEITLISAENLQDVREICRMKVHARVSIIDGVGPAAEQRTPMDKHGETNPAWDFPMRFILGEAVEENCNAMLVIKLYCTRMLGDRYVGEVRTPMKGLFDSSRATGGSAAVNFLVHRGGAVSQGVLTFSYRFGEKMMIDNLLGAERSSTDDGSEKEFPWKSVNLVVVKLSVGSFDVSDVIDFFRNEDA